jgi:hypothetical protein
MEVGLSEKGFAHLPRKNYSDDFTFIVGDQLYSCPSFIASFLSPRIGGLLRADPTIDHFVITTEDPSVEFPHFLSLAEGLTVTVTELNSNFFRSICRELKNVELFENITGSMANILNLDTVLDRLEFLFERQELCESEIEFCSAHFFELDLLRLGMLEFECIWQIVSHPGLKLREEDCLYTFVESLYVRDSRYSILFEYIRFDYLSSQAMESFVELVQESFEILTYPVWQALSPRLSLFVSPECDNHRLITLLDNGDTEDITLHIESSPGISTESDDIDYLEEFDSDDLLNR